MMICILSEGIFQADFQTPCWSSTLRITLGNKAANSLVFEVERVKKKNTGDVPEVRSESVCIFLK